ncbi:methionyl-tRNA formyltransferase [Bifidobacterium bohemicum]|uniref:Methionyl-tRNA formyltransferase n=1 Tax=Bifidobacterium bohemicum DSM 22767 TaxID=1437606 RepID=A0A086ZFV4_9BIFI|nr:methionyl-tRNA formyltransferase [Bifidobacterium bohemicum]KFI45404.1 methionyl-tRNA formyltransferase [Bifidobacterium bohemicum DSM 22767]SCB73677.1 methionyl-tRNA formyltransferase [Bifidobacterium bohemicum]
MLKVLFAGTPEVAVPALNALAQDAEHFEVVAVLTRPDAPQGRGRRLIASPVKQAASELGIPVLESDPKDPGFVDELKATGAQAGAVVAYGKILRQNVLDALPLGWYNLHFSLLPQWRGAAPVQRSLWSGDTITGATVFRLTAGMDTGPILAQSTIEIGAHETSGQLLDRLAQDGSRLLPAALEAMAEGRIEFRDQPQGSYEVAHKIEHDDAHVRFDVPVFAVDRQIRACTPEPGAWCLLEAKASGGAEGEQGEQFHILKARPANPEDQGAPTDLEPGRIVADKKHVWVGTVSTPLELEMVKAQGKKAMRAADWARGARLSVSAVLI